MNDMTQYTQANRFIAIDTPLGKDKLLLTEFGGVEKISEPFQFQVTALSTDHGIKPETLVGKEITVTIKGRSKKVFHGLVDAFTVAGAAESHGLCRYDMTIVPWLLFLEKTGESDLHFISRLLAEEGFFYYFKHSDKKHTLVIVDQKGVLENCGTGGYTYSRDTAPDNEINGWKHDCQFRKGKWTLNDYNFKEPNKNQLVESPTQSKFVDNKKYQHYEYPSLYDVAAGSNLVKLRMEAEEVPLNRIDGTSNCVGFFAGSPRIAL